MTRDEALLQAIEHDLVHFHRQRMAERHGKQAMALAAERDKAHPDPNIIEQLHQAMVQTERDKRDVSITEREVLQPLREAIAKRTASRGT